jgi:DNA-binding MarR family transcriptional regulator
MRAGVTKQSMGEMIDQLAAMGFVTRSADGSDKRAKIVAFTPSGRKLLNTIRKAVAACERDLATRIGDKAVGELRSALTDYCRLGDEAAAASPKTARTKTPRTKKASVKKR